MSVQLSVLVPALLSRMDAFSSHVLSDIYVQANQYDGQVEIISLFDNKIATVGEKRNDLLDMAHGDYVAFVDDDDKVSHNYISSLIDAIDAYHTDVITFDVEVSINGGAGKPCYYSMDYTKDHNTPAAYYRLPNHLMCVKRSIAQEVRFKNIQCGEDSDYARRLKPLLRTEHHINKTLYYYNYSDALTEAQKKPSVSVVMLSKASDISKHKMTQNAIDTCIRNASYKNVNVIVIEQTYATFKHAKTINVQEEFNYNKFCNIGARATKSDYIVFANNDLIFYSNWLRELIKTKKDCVSPLDKSSKKQKDVKQNQCGYENGHDFSGWCFMLSRKAYDKIDGLDEDFKFWCADDSVIEQLRQVGIKPMLCCKSKVLHIKHGSSNIISDDLTWGMLNKFERKYNVEKQDFKYDKRYIAWKRRNGIRSQ
jgi:glycosyltransferase involved in cell wall biosynthesis